MDIYKTASDEQLVEIVRSKDKEQYGEVVRRYEDKLMRYASFLIRDKIKAADVVQESFIKAYVNLNGFNTKKKFSSWIYRIVHNEAMNIVKKHQKETRIDGGADWQSDQNIEEEYDKKEVSIRVRDCLEKMPVMYSEPLGLYFLEDKSYKELSDILRVPMGTVAVRIKRAKILMKRICQKNK